MLSANEKDAVARVAHARSSSELIRIVDDPLHRLADTTLPSGAGALEVSGEHDVSSAQVRVSGTGGAVVGLRTPFLVGWEAVQGGRALTVVRIGAYQLGAISQDVAAGPVDFRYRTPSTALGFTAAALGLLLLAGTMVFLLKPRRARR